MMKLHLQQLKMAEDYFTESQIRENKLNEIGI
jgi:hypothetical protein